MIPGWLIAYIFKLFSYFIIKITKLYVISLLICVSILIGNPPSRRSSTSHKNINLVFKWSDPSHCQNTLLTEQKKEIYMKTTCVGAVQTYSHHKGLDWLLLCYLTSFMVGVGWGGRGIGKNQNFQNDQQILVYSR